jgi:hypothetical protein
MPKYILCLCFGILSSCLFSQQRSTVQGSWLPQIKLVQTFTADSRAHRLSMARNFDQNSWTASMGGALPLLNFNLFGLAAQWGIGGSTWLTLLRNNGAGAVINTDFFADSWLDVRIYRSLYLRVGTGHTSQHLSDDAIIMGIPFTNYAKDFHYVGVVYSPRKNFQTYALVHYNYNFKTQSDLSGKFMLQCGMEHQLIRIKQNHGLYYAMDVKLKEELGFDPTFNAQIGWRLLNGAGRACRLAIDQSLGKEERGSFMYQSRNFARMGIYLDL